eukprot:883644_1
MFASRKSMVVPMKLPGHVQRVSIRVLSSNAQMQMRERAIPKSLEDSPALKSMQKFLKANLSKSVHFLNKDHVMDGFMNCFNKFTSATHPSLTHISCNDRLNLDEVTKFKAAEHCSVVSAERLCSAGNFTIVIFRLLQGDSIPLHDHIGMEVFSKILFGKLRVVGYNWVDEKHNEIPDPSNSSRFAKKSCDMVLSSSSPLVSRIRRDLCYFEAVEDCAVLAVQFPTIKSPKEDEQSDDPSSSDPQPINNITSSSSTHTEPVTRSKSEGSYPTPSTTVAPGTIIINEAEFSELMAIPTVGDSIARRIIDKREFSSWDDLKDRVTGIGRWRLQSIQYSLDPKVALNKSRAQEGSEQESNEGPDQESKEAKNETVEVKQTYYNAAATGDEDISNSHLYRMDPLVRPPKFEMIAHDPKVYLNQSV